MTMVWHDTHKEYSFTCVLTPYAHHFTESSFIHGQQSLNLLWGGLVNLCEAYGFITPTKKWRGGGSNKKKPN